MVAIRPIKAADIEEVHAQVYAHLTPATLEEYLSSHTAETSRTGAILKGREGICLVAEADGNIIAFLIGSIEAIVNPTIRYAIIENIRVEPQHRNRGVGSQLVKSFRKWAASAGATRLSVDVSPCNVQAVHFYERHGLKPATLTLESEI